MLLQAQRENAVADVLVIASGLSIQDPRERPSELAKEADEMQRRFVNKDSDFLTLLNIWNAYHEKMEELSQRKLRKFCKEHFLSYQRMREWRDIHHQLERVLKHLKIKIPAPSTQAKDPDKNVHYAAIHRSIISGLLSNLAVKEEEHNYRGPRNRKAMLFPGSALFDHDTAKKQRKASYQKKGKVKPAKTSAPDWIVCGEWMETSRLFARTAAKIDAAWIESRCRRVDSNQALRALLEHQSLRRTMQTTQAAVRSRNHPQQCLAQQSRPRRIHPYISYVMD